MNFKFDTKKITLLSVAIVLIAFLSFVYATAFSAVKQKLIKSKRINILLLGISETDNARLAEVVKILTYEPETGFLDLVSIPRDTMIAVPHSVSWKRIQKLDEVYSRYWRKNKKNKELFFEFIKVIEKQLPEDFNIDFYLQLDYNAFIDLIDVLDGVDLEVLKAMDYDDSAQDLHIHISSGTHRFNGATALKYVRYRDKIRGDMGRQERQHKFIKSVFKHLKNPEIILKIPAITESILKNIETNLQLADLVILADELRGFKMENFRIQTLPGEAISKWGKSYWKIESEASRETMDVVLNSQLINLPELRIDQNMKATSKVTAEVWNATNTPMLARSLTDYLRKRNVDVVRYGNYGSNKKYTQIISRTGDLKPVRVVSRILGCRNIKTELDTSRMVDVNIVIGGDFKPLWKE